MRLKQTFHAALLADATYALEEDGLAGKTGDKLSGLKEVGLRLTPTLAKYLGDNFTLVTHIETPDWPAALGSGFDASVWRDNSTGKLIVSMQGTKGLGDFLADAVLAFTGNVGQQVIDMVNWWLRICAPQGANVVQYRYVQADGTQAWEWGTYQTVGQGLVSATDRAAGIEVNGHSLGGYLASAFARLLGIHANVSHVSTFNSAGFAPGSEAAFTQLQGVIGLGLGWSRFPSAEQQTNYFAMNGINVTTNSFWFEQVGRRVQIFNEEGTGIPNHSMYKLTDALALGAALERLDPTLDMARLNLLLQRSSEVPSASIERLLDTLGALLGVFAAPLTVGDAGDSPDSRKDYHVALANPALQAALGRLQEKLVVLTSAEEVLNSASARADFAVVAALELLSPLILSATSVEGKAALSTHWQNTWSAQYTAWEADKTAATPLTYTNEWIKDRSTLLGALALRNEQDAGAYLLRSDMQTDRQIAFSYVNPVSGAAETLTTAHRNVMTPTTLPAQFIRFDGDSANQVQGTANALGDRLYGMGGADTLTGLAGNDYLEGGQGADQLEGGVGADTLVGGADADLYVFTASFGNGDVIIDADGQGQIQIDGVALPAGQKIAEGAWRSADQKTSYIQLGNDLTVARYASAGGGTLVGSFTIRDWASMGGNKLGLNLAEGAPSAPGTTQSLVGDRQRQTNTEGTHWLVEGGNYLLAESSVPGQADIIHGGSLAESISGLGGNDALFGHEGADWIGGAEGVDVLMGGLGADTLEGGPGADVIYGSSNGALALPTAVDTQPPEVTVGYTLVGQGLNWVRQWAAPDGDGWRPGHLSDAVLRDRQVGDEGNRIFGGAGDDVILAGTGNDVVEGGLDDDQIVGMGGRDVLRGNEGKDRIYGDGSEGSQTAVFTPAEEQGGDILDGGDGDDLLLGQGGDDTLDGGADNDALWGDDRYLDLTPAINHGHDKLNGRDGNDTLTGGGSNDDLRGGEGDDKMWGDDALRNHLTGEHHGQDYLDGAGGNDTMWGGGSDDELFGGDGADWMWGDESIVDLISASFHGSDSLDGEAGNDSMWGGGGADVLFGDVGDDVLYGDDPLATRTPEQHHGGDYLDGGVGADSLVGGAAADTLYGGSGNDVLWGDAGGHAPGAVGALALSAHGNDYLNGEDGDDTVRGEGGHDTLVGGGGNDFLWGDAPEHVGLATGNDSLAGGDGNDQLAGDGGNDTLSGGEGSDTVSGGVGDDALGGGAGSDSVIGETGNDTIDGGDGDDELQGGAGNDLLMGGVGWDRLFGDAGDDTLDGGDANDQLVGADGNDMLFGSDGNDSLWGNAGDDTLDGGSSDDQLGGGDGNDIVLGSDGNDSLWGEAGNDSLEGGTGDDVLQGGDGNDYLVRGGGSDTLLGDAGDDTIVGSGYGAYGGAGNDTYIITQTLGNTWVDDDQGTNSIRVTGASGSLTLAPSAPVVLGVPLDMSSLRLSVGEFSVDLRGMLDGGIGKVEVNGRTYAATELFGQSFIYGGSATSGTVGDLLQGGRVEDQLTATGGNSTLAGGGGSDTLTGSGGSNTYLYYLGDGSDSISDTGGGTLVFGAGISPDSVRLSTEGSGVLRLTFGDGLNGDVLRLAGFNASVASQPSGISSFEFADGTVLTHAELIERGFDIVGSPGSETLVGTNLVDRLTGGAGGDTLMGGAGADVYTFNTGDGSDVIADNDPAAGVGDTLHFGVGVSPGDIAGLRNGNDLTLVVASTSDQITLRGYFAPGMNAVERIEFAEGTQWTGLDVDNAIALGSSRSWVIVGDSNSNTILGLGGNDSLSGLGGNDTIFGGPGNDTLVGGADDDSMVGGAGSDLYVVNVNSGVDRVDESASGDPAGVDTVRFEDLSSTQVSFLIQDANLNVMDGRGLTRLVVSGQFSARDAANQVERFEFTDGVTLTADQVLAKLLAGSNGQDVINGTGAADSLSGGWANDALHGNAGDDTLHGNQGGDNVNGGDGNDLMFGDDGDDQLAGAAGNDTLTGGVGWDVLDGGLGDDVYAFGAGQGMEIVSQDAGGTDKVQLAAGITATNISLHRVSSPPMSGLAFSGDSLVVQLNGGADQLWIANYFASATQGFVETIQFSDGTSWDFNAVVSRLVAQGGTAGVLTGTNRSNTFIVDHFGDSISDPSYSDADTINSSVSYNVNNENVRNLTLTGTLNLFGSGTAAAEDTLRGTAGDNRFEVTVASYSVPDTFYGGRGNDAYVLRSDSVDVAPNATLSVPANIYELPGEGTDTLITGYWSTQLPDGVENLVLSAPNGYSRRFEYWVTGASDYTHYNIGNGLDNLIDTSAYEALIASQSWFSKRSYPHLIGIDAFRLDGGVGADTLVGGVWHDTYVLDNLNDVVVETGVNRSGQDLSNDTVETPFSTSLLTQFPNIENVTLSGTNPVSATGTAGNNKLSGAANNAPNVLTGGGGDDVYTVGTGDTVVELPGEGTDTVIVSATGSTNAADYPNVERVWLADDAGDRDLLGTAVGEGIRGSQGNNRLFGADGADLIEDQTDDLVYLGSGGGSVVRATADADLLEGGAGDDHLISRGGLDTLDGGAGNDTLHVLYGGRDVVVRLGIGDGQDTLVHDAAGAVTLELKGGVNLFDLQVSKLGGRLTVALSDGASVDMGDANTLKIRLADGVTLVGGEIDLLLQGGDFQTATTAADLLLGSAESEVIDALAGNDLVYAGAGHDALAGGDGNDTLAGRSGNDTLAGNLGADVYRFSSGFGSDVIDDVAVNGANLPDDGAVDTIEFDASIAATDLSISQLLLSGVPSGIVIAVASTGDSITLQRAYAAGSVGAVEQVRFADGTFWDLATLKSKITGIAGSEANDNLSAPSTSYRLEGRGGSDTLTGGAGNDTLDGGSGVDRMVGGAGGDTYLVDSLSDAVVEVSRGGVDLVIASVSGYVLPTEVENGQLAAGTAALNLTGNGLANRLSGNAGNNRLDGGSGVDTMVGGRGDDVYVVNVSGDTVTELADEGVDTVESLVSYTLPATVENLLLSGTATKLVATGNGLANYLRGNSVANTLVAGAGDDTLNGAGGKDTLTGGTGADTFVFDLLPSSTNVDTITDFVPGADKLGLSAAIFPVLGLVGGAVGLSPNLTYTPSTGVLAYDADGPGGAAAVAITIIGAQVHPATLGNDFILV